MTLFSCFARPLQRLVCVLLGALAMVGCEKRSGEATVLSKEHIPAEAAVIETGKERAATEERWAVNVEMRSNLRKVHVLVGVGEWEKLKIGDGVHVQYSEGKYTGTIWSSDLK